MTLLADLVATSRRVAETPGRNAKIAELAALLGRLEPPEIELGVAYLSGNTRQGRSGIGFALLSEAGASAPASSALLSLLDVDAALERIAKTSGSGSRAARIAALSGLFANATEDERDFLSRLLVGCRVESMTEPVSRSIGAACAAHPLRRRARHPATRRAPQSRSREEFGNHSLTHAGHISRGCGVLDVSIQREWLRRKGASLQPSRRRLADRFDEVRRPRQPEGAAIQEPTRRIAEFVGLPI